jgi:hypothetical protein
MSSTIVAIEIEHSNEPIRGAITAPTGHHPFYGWLELTAALEALRAHQLEEHPDADNRNNQSTLDFPRFSGHGSVRGSV